MTVSLPYRQRYCQSARSVAGTRYDAADLHSAKALAAMHDQLDRPWTLAALGRVAGLSRAAFAARFSATVGEAPMRYLLGYRMRRRVQKAHRFRAWSLPARRDGKDTTAGLTAGAPATAHLQRRGVPALILLPIFVSHQFDPLRPPGWWLPWLVDVDPLANDLAFAEFHDADDHVRARAVVPDRVFVDP